LFRTENGSTALAFTPDGQLLLVNNESTITVWETETWHARASLDWGMGEAKCLAISPNGLVAAAAGYAGEIVIWDLDG
jgi:WD40 repeat protein